MLCPVCRHDNFEGEDYCENCGADLAGGDTPESALDFQGRLLGEHLEALVGAAPLVDPGTSVHVALDKMHREGLDCLLVVSDRQLIGIFTERDALNKALAPDRDVSRAKVSDLMTKDPYCIPPAMTIADAMEIVTQRQIRHLPIVQDGKVLGLISSRDLTDWVVKNSLQEDGDLATRCPVAAI